MKRIVFPAPLAPGAGIALLSPASEVKREYIDGAVAMLRSAGFSPIVMPSALGPADGSYAASLEVRLEDMRRALSDPEVKCIMCGRGGYGCVHLLPYLSERMVKENPKWLVGFSDVSALHALWLKAGVASVHASMARHLALFPVDDPATSELLSILRREGLPDYSVAPYPDNIPGEASGVLKGGNLAVLNSLAATPFDILDIRAGEDVILFIEDVSEPIYAVERMLMRLWLSGALSRVRGLVVGRFTEYRPDRNFDDMESMITALLKRCGLSSIPVAFNFPVGHFDGNLPLVEGARTHLSVTESCVRLTQTSR